VLGPRGAPAPDDTGVTGDPDAGHAAALSKAAARTRAARTAGGRVAAVAGDRWFALGGEPALTNADVARARPDVDGATGEPLVQLDLSASGQGAFRDLTRELARRGTDRALPGTDKPAAFQHLAIVLDDAILAVPYIDFQQAPDGLDGSRGAVIEGGLTRQTARDIASVLNTGPLPATLSPLPG
jgi:SecD/SecF fusion protein